ncbi:germ cell nuclear acidic protein-like [Macrobrachium nipponense]|uniref:germ cell nuclear acidic protein-like n=1 Tax=Macrobrachium nipponense TaxID=159736 RepID=UPI0030C87842
MPGKDSDKGDVPDGNGTSDIQHAKDNEGNAEPPSDENNTGNDKEESSILEKDQLDNVCNVVEQLVTFPLSQSVDDVTGNPFEAEDKSQDLDCNVTTNNDDIKDTDSDSDIFAISAPEGDCQVMEITDDEGHRSQDEPRAPYTIGSLSPVDDGKNELDSLEEIVVAASVYRNDESGDDMPGECDMDLEVNKESDIEDDLENDDKGSNMMSEGHRNLDLETVSKLRFTKGKSTKEKKEGS